MSSEAATASVLHEVGHVEQVRQGLKSTSAWENEAQAYSLGELYAKTVTGREIDSSYRLIRDHLLGVRPTAPAKPTETTKTESKTVLSSEEFEREIARLKSQLLDIQSSEVQRKAKATTIPKKTPQKPFLAAPTGHHSLERYRPKISVGGSVGCFG